MPSTVYLDNAATTRVAPEAAAAAAHAMTEAFGNPSSAHRLGLQAARLLTEARERVARAIDAAPEEILFTSGGTEANGLALMGAAQADRGRHLVVSGLEHPSVADSARRLGERGYELSVVPCDRRGLIDPQRFAEAIRPDTAVAAVLWVQNELGTIQPIDELAAAVKARAPRCHLHVDAVQAAGKLRLSARGSAVDSLALSAHKLHGPKGVGALWLRKGRRILPLVQGGGQERGLRPGTEGVPGICAFGVAIALAEAARAEAAPRMARLRDRLWAGLLEAIPEVIRHGDPEHQAPHILSVGFPHAPAEPLLHALEARGVYVSAGSACHARERRPSPTLRALGVAEHVATLRFSLSRETTAEEIDQAVTVATAALAELR